jgi:hypothetical protein
MVGGPRVFGVIVPDESGGGGLGGLADFCEGDAFVVLGKSFEQFDGAEEEAGGGAEAASVDAVRWFAVMVLEMDKPAGELDERFVKGVMSAIRPEPDMLENVVRLVVALRVEEPEIS